MNKGKNTHEQDNEEITEEQHVGEGQEQEVLEESCECEEKIADLENKYKRVLADYQNLEKRSREERSEWIKSANRELLLRILPVLDTLVLAQQHSTDQTLKVVTQQFLDVLKSEGVTRIETVGQLFDPHLMEVVSVLDGEDNTVLSEMRAGYLLGDKLLRVAHVTVGKGNE